MHESCTVSACLASLCYAQALIDCSQYGDPGRFSDPSIGAAVNNLARTGAVSPPFGNTPCLLTSPRACCNWCHISRASVQAGLINTE